VSIFSRPQKRGDATWVKVVGLTPGAFHYRLALEAAEAKPNNIPLGDYYAAMLPIISERNSIAKWYFASLIAMLLYKLKLLSTFEIPFLTVNPEIVGFVIFSLFSFSSLIFSSHQAKINRAQSLFGEIFNKASGAKKQDLLLRFPEMYQAISYVNWLSLGPKYMYPLKSLPILQSANIILMLASSIILLIFNCWLVVSVTIDLYLFEMDGLGVWGKVALAGCWVALIMACLQPSNSYRKLWFSHYGLSQLLERYRKANPTRYRAYILRLAETEHGARVFQKDTNMTG
jgi:hypothetical protein